MTALQFCAVDPRSGRDSVEIGVGRKYDPEIKVYRRRAC